MAADLPVPLDGGGTLMQVHSLYDGVRPITFPDFQHGGLDPSFPVQGTIVREEIKLESAGM